MKLYWLFIKVAFVVPAIFVYILPISNYWHSPYDQAKDCESSYTHRSMAFSPDGKLVAAGWNGTDVGVWDSTTGMRVHRFPLHLGKEGGYSPLTLAFSDDGKSLLIGEYSGASLWNVETEKLIHIFEHDPEKARQGIWAYFMPHTDYVLTVDVNEAILWNRTTGAKELAMAGYVDSEVPVSFSSDGRYVLLNQGYWYLWDLQTKQESKLEDFNLVTPAKITPDGKYVIGLNHIDSTVRFIMWNVETHEITPIPKSDDLLVRSLDISSNSRYMVISGYSLWDILERKELRSFDTSSQLPTLTKFFPDNGKLLVYGPKNAMSLDNLSQELQVWDINQLREIQHYSFDNELYALEMSSDGKFLAVGLRRGNIEIWDIESGRNRVSLCWNRAA